MKLNKSILGIALVLVFLLGSCSNARYGNLTRRVKTNNLATNLEKSNAIGLKAQILVDANNLSDKNEISTISTDYVRLSTSNSTQLNVPLDAQNESIFKNTEIHTEKNMYGIEKKPTPRVKSSLSINKYKLLKDKSLSKIKSAKTLQSLEKSSNGDAATVLLVILIFALIFALMSLFVSSETLVIIGIVFALTLLLIIPGIFIS